MPFRAAVTLYVVPKCSYCESARDIFRKRKVDFEEIFVDDKPEVHQWLIKTVRQRTTPQVFINGRSIGGPTQLLGLDKRGQLDALLEVPPPEPFPEIPLSRWSAKAG
jgi:glutaredoxin 3